MTPKQQHVYIVLLTPMQELGYRALSEGDS